MKNIKITELKKYLKTKSDKELIQEIVEIYKISPKAKEYFSIKVNPNYEKELLAHYKDIIENQFFPSRGDSVLNYSVLRKAISDFNKVAETPDYIAELMITYVENGVEFTNTYGDIDETFYNNIARMYDRAIRYIIDHNLEDKFQSKCERVMLDCEDIGWGFGIFMEECYYDGFGYDEDED